MTNEDVGEKIIRIETDSLKKGFNFFLRNGSKLAVRTAKKPVKSIAKIHNNRKTTGKQSYKQMYKSGQGLSAFDFNEKPQIKQFQKCAKKYSLDFAVNKDRKTGKYVMFFKAKDKEVFDKVVEEYKEKLGNSEKEEKSQDKAERSHSPMANEKNQPEEKKESLTIRLEKAKKLVNEMKSEKVKNKTADREM